MKSKKKSSKKQQLDKVAGLYQYCPTCKKWINGRNGFTCNHDNWYYRIVINDSVTGKAKSLILKTKDRQAAVEETLKFRQSIMAMRSDNQKSDAPVFDITNEIALYQDFLSDEGVPDNEKKNRTKKYINDHIRCLKWYHEFRKSDITEAQKGLSEVNNVTIARFIQFLQDKSYTAGTIKMTIATMSNWFKFLIVDKKYKMNNPWENHKFKQ